MCTVSVGGIVKFRWELVNQKNEVPVSMVGTQFFLRRPQAGLPA